MALERWNEASLIMERMVNSSVDFPSKHFGVGFPVATGSLVVAGVAT